MLSPLNKPLVCSANIGVTMLKQDIQERYKDAQKLTRVYQTSEVIRNDVICPFWLEGRDQFVYVKDTKAGREFRLVDAKALTNTLAFDHSKLAESLSKEVGLAIEAEDLPIYNVTLTLPRHKVCFESYGRHWYFDSDAGLCGENAEMTQPVLFDANRTQKFEWTSPDGKLDAFIRNCNVWIRDHETGQEQSLTSDGTQENSYSHILNKVSTTNTPLLWSPDSKKIFAIKLDFQDVRKKHWFGYGQKHDYPAAYNPNVGDDKIYSLSVFIVDVDTGEAVAHDYPDFPYVLADELGLGLFSQNLAWWSDDSRCVFFVDMSRGCQSARLIKLKLEDGSWQVLIEESEGAFQRIRPMVLSMPNLLPLSASNELIWPSERSGSQQLYLYDLSTGKLKHSITEGVGRIRNLLHYNEEERELLVQMSARNPGTNPYYLDICRINIDTGDIVSIIDDDFNYVVNLPTSLSTSNYVWRGLCHENASGVSPCGSYVVTTRTRVDRVPETVLFDRKGHELMTIEQADVSGLPEAFCWPEPVKMKAADSLTDIYGVIYRPPGFEEACFYPVIEYSCSSRTLSCLPVAGFNNDLAMGCFSNLACALAALGFIVVSIEGRGAPLRDTVFEDFNIGDPACDSAIVDRIAGIRQLAERYSYMDLDRVGLVEAESTSTGIYGLMHHSDFYKVGVEHCMADDLDNGVIAEIAGGFRDGKLTRNLSRIAASALQDFNGRVLFIQGMQASIDGVFQLIEALQALNKDMDMICLPNTHNHMPSYATRREWDYLVKHLLNVEPPKNFKLTTGLDVVYSKTAKSAEIHHAQNASDSVDKIEMEAAEA